MRWIRLIVLVVVWLGSAASAPGGDLAWTGTLLLVQEDAGTGVYTGGIPGSTMFAGTVFFPDTCGATCTVEPFPPDATNYVFSDGTGSISGVGATTIGIESSVEIIDEEVLGPDAVELAALFGVTITAGQTVDAWTVDSQTAGEFMPGFVAWGLSYVYVTTDPFTNTSFTPTPPPNPDFILWELVEEDGDAYAVLGEVDSVPEPGFIAMLGVGTAMLGGLAGRSRRRRVR